MRVRYEDSRISHIHSLPYNTIFLESVTDLATTCRDPYTDYEPILWSPTNCHMMSPQVLLWSHATRVSYSVHLRYSGIFNTDVDANHWHYTYT